MPLILSIVGLLYAFCLLLWKKQTILCSILSAGFCLSTTCLDLARPFFQTGLNTIDTVVEKKFIYISKVCLSF